MSDDIPPLIPETPPPMTKLDWEDDEDFMDFPHLALEMPSESSLSPDSGWNPVDELSLPYDGHVNERVGCIEPSSNNSLSNWSSDIVKTDQYLKSSISEQEPNLHIDNLSIWKDKGNIVPWENIEKLTSIHSCDSDNELDCKSEINDNESSENVIDSNKKITDDNLSVTTEQQTSEVDNIKNNTTLQYSPNVELQLNNLKVVENIDIQPDIVSSEKISCVKTLANGHLECVNSKEVPNQTSRVQNVLLENVITDANDDAKVNSPNSMYEICNNDLTLNNNNNIIIKNDQEECTDFSDFETAISNSINVPLPNRTSQEHEEIIENHLPIDQHQEKILPTKIDDDHCKIAHDISIITEKKLEQNVESVNLNSSTFKNQQNNVINAEENVDSEFDDFCDFHTFTTSTTEIKSTCATNDDDFCDFETSKPAFNDNIKFEHSKFEKVKIVTSNDNDDLIFKPENQNKHIEDDDNFCDFESGYSGYGFDSSHDKVSDTKPNNEVDSEFPTRLNYKQFCKDAFNGDYESCEEVDLHNLDDELNESKVWQNLKDIDSSPALNYNWSKSESNSVFLSSLSIDSRNILYGASWNPKMPRFAANLSNNPLEPLKASNNDATDTKISQSFSNSPLQETVPDPEFDWKSSGLINPLDCNHTSLLDLELLDTLAPCCTNALQPQTWKTSTVVKEEEIPVQSSPESIDVFDQFFSASSSDNQSMETIESPSIAGATVSVEAQRILDNLPDFEVLQKPYLVILEKESNNFFLH